MTHVDSGAKPPPPPRVGAELVSPGDRVVLWCAKDTVVEVLDALKRGGVDTKVTGPRPRFHHSQLREARRRRHPELHGQDTEQPAEQPTDHKPLPPVANCQEAMACSKASDADVFYFQVPIQKYEQVVLHLKSKKLIHPNYATRADGGLTTRRAMLPSSTFIVALNRKLNTSSSGNTRGLSTHRGYGTADASTSDAINDRLDAIPKTLKESLYQFQRDGVLFGLQRGGRCLIADQMGVGKTIQALAIVSCYRGEGPLLVVAPASMRLTWARECERWFPELLTKNLVVVNGGSDSYAVEHVRVATDRLRETRRTEARDGFPEGLDADTDNADNDLMADPFTRMKTRCTEKVKQYSRRELERPRVVVISFHMAYRLERMLLETKWGAMIVDESHALRTSGHLGKDAKDNNQTTTVTKLIKKVKRCVLCTGTPSLTKPFDLFNQIDSLRPGLLGATKKQFAETYCDLKISSFTTVSGQAMYDCTGGSRLQELHALLTKEVMIRRLKQDVLSDLPPKWRQVVPIETVGVIGSENNSKTNPKRKSTEDCEGWSDDDELDDEYDSDDSDSEDSEETREARIANTEASWMSRLRESSMLKLPGAVKWLREVLSVAEDDGVDGSAGGTDDLQSFDDDDLETSKPPKMVIFAHHIDVMDRITDQVLHWLPRVTVKGGTVEGFIRIDGSVNASERGAAVDRFRNDPFCRVALVSVRAGGVGIDLSAAQSVVFVELAGLDASMVEQAEDRVHRRGLKNAVNVYFLLANGGAAGRVEERRWASIERSLNKVRRAVDGENVVDERGLAPEAVGRGFQPGSERQPETAGTEYFTSAWLGDDDRTEKENPGRRNETQPVGETNCPYILPPPPDDLWFETSANTGRVHLHLTCDGCEPLGESVAPNDLRRVASAIRKLVAIGKKNNLPPSTLVSKISDASDCDTLCPRLQGDLGAILAAQAFIDEFDALTAVDRNLLSKGHVPAKSPVAETVCLLQGEAAAVHEASILNGVANGGSTKRHGGGRRRPLPPCADYRPVLVKGERGAYREYKEPVDENLEPLCLVCMSKRGGMGGVNLARVPVELRPMVTHPIESRPGVTHQPIRIHHRELIPVRETTYLESPSAASTKACGAIKNARAALKAAEARETELKNAAADKTLSAAQNVKRRIERANATSCVKAAAKRVTEVENAANSVADVTHTKSAMCLLAPHESTEKTNVPSFILDSKFQMYCSAQCHSLDMQTTSSHELRRLIKEKEKGVCVQCHWDASGCAKRISVMRSKPNRRKHILKSKPEFGHRGNSKLLEQFTRTAWEGHVWHFDHIVAVYEGGGECTVDNGQTLCVLCHKIRTAQQAKQRAAARREAKKKMSENLTEIENLTETETVATEPKNTSKKKQKTSQTKRTVLHKPHQPGYVEDSQLLSSDEETLADVVADFESDEENSDLENSIRSESDSKPIPETEPVCETQGLMKCETTDFDNETAEFTEIAVVPETELQGDDLRPGPAFAGTADFDVDEAMRSARHQFTQQLAAMKKDPLIELLDSDDDAPWTY